MTALTWMNVTTGLAGQSHGDSAYPVEHSEAALMNPSASKYPPAQRAAQLMRAHSNLPLVRQKLHWVQGLPLLADLKMQFHLVRIARTHLGNFLPLFDFLTFRNKDFFVVCVCR